MSRNPSRTATSAWRGTVLVSFGHALYVGPAGDTQPHRHHALQLVVALEGPFEAQLGRADPRSFDSLLVAAGTEHRIDGRDLQVAIYYVDASSEEGRVLSGWLEGEEARDLPSDVGGVRQILERALARPSATVLPFLRARVAALLQHASSGAPARDPAVAAVCSLLEETLGAPLPIPALARRVGLPQREVSARFRRETGLTIRRYVLWLRLKRAVATLAEERTLTEAAYAAGFSDAAHLSRTFVQMFGVSPSESLVASRVQVLGHG